MSQERIRYGWPLGAPAQPAPPRLTSPFTHPVKTWSRIVRLGKCAEAANGDPRRMR